MLELWHGGKRWDGKPEIRPVKAGRYECGPGLYLTTQYERARKHARGGGKVVTLVTLADNIRWLEQARLPLAALMDWIDGARGLRNRAAVRRDMADAVRGSDPESVWVSFLVNLCVYHNAVPGNLGQELAEWLAGQGIDASLHCPGGDEDWVVVFNPAIIVKHRVVPGAEIKGCADLPRVPR